MNRTLLIAGFALSAATAAAAAEPTWLTVVGDPADAFVDTVEVDATSAVAFEAMRMVKLRVNRAKTRMGFDGQPFHSYYSTAIVDCTESKAWHRSVALFDNPLWRGRMRMVEFAESDGRSLAFAEMDPNPRDRLIKAACSIALQGM